MPLASSDYVAITHLIPLYHANFEFREAVKDIYVGVTIYIMEKAMAPHSSTLAWKIPWMEEPGRLQSMGSLRLRHD